MALTAGIDSSRGAELDAGLLLRIGLAEDIADEIADGLREPGRRVGAIEVIEGADTGAPTRWH